MTHAGAPTADICGHGCATSERCTGRCQPAPRDPGRCKWCRAGHLPDASGEHWIVKSIARATIEIRKCEA